MKKLALLLLTFVALGSAVFSADVAVNGKLTTWAGMETNATDADSDASDSVGYLYVNGELNTKVELADNVTVVMELELHDKVSNGASMSNPGNNDTVTIDEAYVSIGEFFMSNLTLKIGHQWIENSLRSNHRAMVIASDFTAFKGTFKFESGALDVIYGKASESLLSVNTSSDSDLIGLHVAWDFNENIHVIGYVDVATFDNAGADHGNAITIGAGIDYFLLDKALELYLEIAGQFGDVNEDVSRSALALDLGARWTFKELGSIKGLYVELNLGYRSGQDDDTDVTKFWNSWAGNTGALLAESDYNRSSTNSENPMYQGYADDSVMAIRLEAGADWTEKIGSHLLLGMFTGTDESNGVGTTEDAYGVEVDLCTVYKHSENVNFIAHIAAFMPDDGLAVDGDTIFALAFETTVSF